LQSGSGASSRTVQAKARATVSVEDFGAVGDGTTDDSAAVLAAIAALPTTGGVVEFERAVRYKCTIGAVTKKNVCLRGKSFLEDASVSVQLVPADNDAYLLEVGDGTTNCEGFRLEGVSLNGLGSGKYGLKINGAERCHYSQFSAQGFTIENVYITSSATHPTHYQFFDAYSIQASSAATSQGLLIDYGSQYVAAIFFNNGVIGAQATSLWALKMTQVRAMFSNTWIEGDSGNCISLNTAGGTNAVMECANVIVDSDSAADVLVNVDSNTRVNAWLRGTVYVDGIVAMPGGNTAAITSMALLPPNSFLTSCFVNGSGLFFLDGALSEWARWDQSATQMVIVRSGTNLNITNSAGGVVVTGAAGSALTYVGREFRLSDSSGQRTTTLHAVTTLSGLSGATATATNLIPAGSVVIGVTVRVTTTITGATSFEIGDGTDPDRWGTTIAVTSGTTTTNANTTITTVPIYAAATSVVLTANGGNFTAGAVKVTVHYISLTAATS
jgi:hypothetical protein